jgi:hypothetical protein
MFSSSRPDTLFHSGDTAVRQSLPRPSIHSKPATFLHSVPARSLLWAGAASVGRVLQCAAEDVRVRVGETATLNVSLPARSEALHMSALKTAGARGSGRCLDSISRTVPEGDRPTRTRLTPSRSVLHNRTASQSGVYGHQLASLHQWRRASRDWKRRRLG